MFSQTEIKVLERGSDFAPTLEVYQLRKDFVKFYRKMQMKWHFCNKITEAFNTTSVFLPKSNWIPSLGHPNLKMFLSKLEKELFEDSNVSHFHQQNISHSI